MFRPIPSPAPALAALAVLLILGPLSNASGSLAFNDLVPSAAAAKELKCRQFPNANAFADRIDHPYMPLIPGTTYIFEGSEDGEKQRNVVEVTRGTRTILGVKATVVRDTVFDHRGELIEKTLDWFAQDRAGNVWYLGEASRDYKNGKVVSTKGSWEAGKDGARPGIIMLAHPRKGADYHQECAPGVAEDFARILDLDTPVNTAHGDYRHTLRIRETNPLEPGVAEDKFYARCAGLVKIEVVKGGRGSFSLVDVKNEPTPADLGCKDPEKHHL